MSKHTRFLKSQEWQNLSDEARYRYIERIGMHARKHDVIEPHQVPDQAHDRAYIEAIEFEEGRLW